MALIACPDCGKQVSTMASGCPHCGYPLKEPVPPPPAAAAIPSRREPAAKRGTSPWTIIGWLVLAFMALVVYSCTKTAMNLAEVNSTSSYSPTSTNGRTNAVKSYTVKVIDNGCQESASGRYTTVRATVENTGTETIPFAKAFFEGHDRNGALVEAKDSYFSPSDIPPGARASADVSLRGEFASCGMVKMQGSNGSAVSLL
jgi:hypothetical protein